MQYKEFGHSREKTILLLHGGGLSWWNYREAAEMLKNTYHIIIPVLDGHAGSDRHFTSIEDNAAEIISFIREHLGGSVYMICGLSLGAQILLEILSQQGDICRHALIESAAAIPSKAAAALIRPAFACSYPLIRQKWFARLQFRQLRIKEALFDDYYRDTCVIEKDNMTAFLRANMTYRLKDTLKACTADVRIFYGEKETRIIRRSAARIHETLPASTLTALTGMYHGDFSINHPADFVRAVKNIAAP